MLLKGGCGYEDHFRLRSPVAVEHRFDRMLDALETASRATSVDNWPPYDIVKTGEDDYHISMAVAGFTQDDLTITQEQNMLIVIGQKIGDEDRLSP